MIFSCPLWNFGSCFLLSLLCWASLVPSGGVPPLPVGIVLCALLSAALLILRFFLACTVAVAFQAVAFTFQAIKFCLCGFVAAYLVRKAHDHVISLALTIAFLAAVAILYSWWARRSG